MMQMDWVLAESFDVLQLASSRIEVTLDSGLCNGHILNKWRMQI
jgi:hypothetical protein